MATRVSLTKRSLIEANGRQMFVWVAIASVVVSFALVAVQFIYQDFKFNADVLSAKHTALSNLQKNETTAKQLNENVELLLANENLAKTKSYDTQDNLGVIIDALPVQPTVTTLPAAIQKIIAPRASVNLTSIATPAEVTATEQSADTPISPTENIYSVEIAGSYDAIKNFLTLLEKSVRPIQVVNVDMSGTEASIRASISLKTYHQQSKTFVVKKKVISQ